ncbi:hypothetical protein THASP1DRAFT_31971 [Thamnocephalis sphaerospora]|uniref:Uncharacterized protein n=1 Tax=Thamnocephalis sphaerospora TaxID=78915 RepID=A0A4P9XK91_9FUNG|nr:hypothetical protein THASP1DRAFT_31971 [Thamnocephalis sphaerospora]|eukprot:RKP06213.1 hypothetical protein THASP1DRAFT_31971 [Thamnocephalis sphaerospora]
MESDAFMEPNSVGPLPSSSSWVPHTDAAAAAAVSYETQRQAQLRVLNARAARACSTRPRHELLWALAREYLRHAKQLLPSLGAGGDAVRDAYRRDILGAISCLKAVLLSGLTTTAASAAALGAHASKRRRIKPTESASASVVNTLSTTVELRTRCMLGRVLLEHTDNDAEAEMHARKTIQLSRGIIGMDELRMDAYDVQLEVLLRAGQLRLARTLLRDTLLEAEHLDLHAWRYHFMRRRAHLMKLEAAETSKDSSNIKDKTMMDGHKETPHSMALAVLLELAKTAREYKHDDVGVDTMLTRAQWAMALGDERTAASSLADASTTLQRGASIPEPEPLGIALSTGLMAARPRASTSLLRARFLLLQTLFSLWQGRTQDARATLRQLQDVLDWWTLLEAEPVNNTHQLEATSRNVDTHDGNVVYISWMSRRQIATLAVYLSAVAHKGVTNAADTQQQLADSEASTKSAVGNLQQAGLAWSTAVIWCRDSGVWQRYADDLVLRRVWLLQATGKPDETRHYLAMLAHGATSPDAAFAAQCALAMMDTVLLRHASTADYSAPSGGNYSRDDDDLDFSTGAHPQATMWSHVVLGAQHSFGDRSRRGKKTALLAALRAANACDDALLYSMVTLRLAELYQSVEDTASERMLSVAYALACDAGSAMLALVAGERLLGTCRRYGRHAEIATLEASLAKWRAETRARLASARPAPQ